MGFRLKYNMQKPTFWGFAKQIFKKSKFLYIKYIFLAVYLIVTSALANLLSLDNLTYYNSCISLVFFGDMVAFSISSGIGIFINQHLKQREYVENYARLGLYVSFFVAIFLGIIFFVFADFFVYTFLGLENVQSLTFYKLMVSVYLVTMTICAYLEDILVKLELFKMQMVQTFLQCSLIILGFVIIALTSSLSLIYIATIYISAMAVVLFFFVFVYLKKIKLNIFKPKFVKISFKNAKILLCVFVREILWEIGGIFCSFFILKISENIFDTYAYYENVLDLFNAIFYAMMHVLTIEISTALGENDINKARKITTYSLKIIGLCWIFYAICTLAFSYGVIYFLNSELKSTAFITLILYVLLYLIKFYSLGFSSYILGTGGKTFSLALVELFGSVYFITFYLLSAFIPANIYLIYAILYVEELIKLITLFILYKKSNWLGVVK